MLTVTDVYADFLVECRGVFEDLCRRIDAGEVPEGASAKLTIEVSSGMVDQLAAMREVPDGES